MPESGLERLNNAAVPLMRRLYRYRRLVPLASFALGAASFFLVERQMVLAQWLMGLLLIGWVWLLAEGLIGRWLARWFGHWLPYQATRFGAQMLHQETLFFVLPFFLITTTWASGQILFTGSLVAAALVSSIDPLYGWVTARRWLFFGFHSLSLFAALLVALPVLLELTAGQSLAFATAAMVVFALPSIAAVIDVRRTRRWVLFAVLAAGLGALVWASRGWIPPATLRVTEAAITYRVNQAEHSYGRDHFVVPSERLDEGLYAFTAIRAPLGLRQPVVHVWAHEGKVVDRIRLEIVGGRERGYRAWSHKDNFPTDSRGDWQVSVMTADGQLIGRLHFRVK